jgi:hypothetical protein
MVQKDKKKVGFAAIADFLRTNPTARSVLLKNAAGRLRECGLPAVETPEHQYKLVGVSKSTFYEAKRRVLEHLATHYDAGLSGTCWDCLEAGDEDGFKVAYKERHRNHEVNLTPKPASVPASSNLNTGLVLPPSPPVPNASTFLSPFPSATSPRTPPFPALTNKRNNRPQAFNDRLASVYLSFEQGDVSLPMIELNCQVAEIDPLLPRLYIQRAILEVHLNGGELTSQSDARARLDAFMASHSENGGKFAIARLGGPRDRPSWEFETTEGSLELRSILPLCELAGLAVGQKLKFMLRVFSKELRAEEAVAAAVVAVQTAPQEEKGPLARADGQPLGQDRVMLMKLLWEKSLPGRQNGSVVLATDETEIVAAPVSNSRAS